MNNQIFKIFFRILWLAIAILLIYYVWKLIYNELNLWNSSNTSTNTQTTTSEKNENITNFKSINSSEIARTWVAIWTNIWTKHFENNWKKEVNSAESSIYKEIFSIEELKKNRILAKENLINKNMLETKEYFYLLRTDFKSLIEKSKNKKNTLETIYTQLKIRYNNAIDSIKNLQSQKAILLAELESINSRTESLKAELSQNFKNSDNVAVNENIEKYLELKNEYIFIRTYTVFVNNFLKYYVALNEHNLKLINALSLNKDAIIKGSYIVLPSSGNEVLKEYGLLYTEEEFQQILKQKENE